MSPYRGCYRLISLFCRLLFFSPGNLLESPGGPVENQNPNWIPGPWAIDDGPSCTETRKSGGLVFEAFSFPSEPSEYEFPEVFIFFWMNNSQKFQSLEIHFLTVKFQIQKRNSRVFEFQFIGLLNFNGDEESYRDVQKAQGRREERASSVVFVGVRFGWSGYRNDFASEFQSVVLCSS